MLDAVCIVPMIGAGPFRVPKSHSSKAGGTRLRRVVMREPRRKPPGCSVSLMGVTLEP
jgi:hypothetical protein